jgi:glucose/arabinose dehydrogenase/cytochrome c2
MAMKYPLRSLSLLVSVAVLLGAAGRLTAQSDVGDPVHGKALFVQSCILCHSVLVLPDKMPVAGQGPGLAGVVGRPAGSLGNFGYSKALRASGITWNPTNLEQFLAAPFSFVPGTNMPVVVPSVSDRRDLVAYLGTLTAPGIDSSGALIVAGGTDPADWHHAAPGMSHRIDLAALPAPYASRSAGNPPKVVDRPADAILSVPPGFSVNLFADGLSGPRVIRVAPNGDIFIAETKENRIRVLRAADGASAPSENAIYATGLDRPFGVAFYPVGSDPQWVYVATNNTVVRFAYKSGDLKATGEAQIILPSLSSDHNGAHTTRDLAFSSDGKRMYVTVGSGSNVAEEMPTKNDDERRAWDSSHAFGEAWGPEEDRALIKVTDPEGKAPLRVYATGIRNPVGLAINPTTGDLWTSTNERDALGDDLVPDYFTSVKEGAFYGWPWYYLGSNEDPRHARERPELAGHVTVPDIPIQSHSAPLEIVYYTAKSGSSLFPADYQGDLFVALHGSWNRTHRTGYKVVRARFKDGVATGEYDDFLTGFVVDSRSVWGRPVGVAVARDGALLVTDDGNGTLWRISYGSPAGP